MKVGSFIISPVWFNILTLFPGLSLSVPVGMGLEKRFPKEGGIVTKREVGICPTTAVHYSDL